MVLNIADALSAYRQGGGTSASATGLAGETAGGSFSDTLKGFVGDTVGALQEGEKAATSGATGKADLASIVTAISKAELMLQTVVTIRDKVIAAYQDISKTAI
jgi:flagellar hook-basal body complex protein FliE